MSRVIVVDLDETIVDLLNPWIEGYNTLGLERPLEISDFRSYNIDDVVAYPDRMCAVLHKPKLFRNLDPIPGAVETIADWQRSGDHVIVASYALSPQIAADKMIWCQERLPFVSEKQICLWAEKWRIHADVIVDDCPEVIREFCNANPQGCATGLLRPYNQSASFLRGRLMSDWAGIRDFVRGVK